MTTPPHGSARGGPRLPKPGWMPDPSQLDIERYWDGQRWTPRTRDRVSKRERLPLGEPGRRPTRERRERKGGRRVIAGVAIAALVAVPTFGYLGALPSWVPWPQEWTVGTPEGPAVAYPVFGSDDLVTYLARSMVAQEDSISVTFVTATSSDGQGIVEDAMAEALTQNPYVFVRGWNYTSQTGVATVEPQYIYNDGDAEARRQATATAVAELVDSSGAATAGTDAERATLVHDAITAQATYDFEAFASITAEADSPAVDASQEAYGILVNRTAVCTGYAEAFLLAADAVGLPAVIVTGDVSDGLTVGGHAWNRVLVDGVWRVVDVTWDDVDTAGGGAAARQDYLLIGDGHPLLASRTADDLWVVDANLGAFG